MKTLATIRTARLVAALGATTVAVANAAFVGTVDFDGARHANHVVAVGQYAYVVVDSDGGTAPELFVVDIDPPRTSGVVGSLDVGSDVRSIWTDGTRAYLATADDAAELMIVDLTNKSAPALVGTFDLPQTGDGSAVTAIGTTVFVGTSNNPGADAEFFIVDAANPANPTLLGSFDVGAAVNDMVATAGLAFLATAQGTSEFLALNVTVPNAITIASSVNVAGSTVGRGLAIDSGRLYGTTDDNGANADFFAWSIGAGGALTSVGSLNLGSNNRRVAAASGRAYVTSTTPERGLAIVDIRIPAAPVELTTFSTNGAAHAVSLLDGIAYLATANEQQEFQVVAASPRAHHPPLAAQRDAGVVPVAITGIGFGDGGVLVFTQGPDTLIVGSMDVCNDVLTSSCIVFWDSDWITAKLPAAWSAASVQVVTGPNAIDRTEMQRIQYYALDYTPSQLGPIPPLNVNPHPLALAVDGSDPLHRVWLNDESRFYFKSVTPGSPSFVTALPFNHPNPPPFYTVLNGSQTIMSGQSEEVLVDPHGRVWFSETGQASPLLQPQAWNYARIAMYRWDSTPGHEGDIVEMRMYNMPGQDPGVRGMAYEANYDGQGHDRVWYTAQARGGGIFDTLPARIGWFDPDEPGLAHDGTRVFSPSGACLSWSCSDVFGACCSDNSTRRCLWDTDCNLSSSVCYFGEDRPGCIFHEYKLPAFVLMPSHIQLGPDGAIWYASYWGRGNDDALRNLGGSSLGRLATDTGEVTVYPLGDDPTRGQQWTIGSSPWELTTVFGQDIVVNEYSDCTINRFDVSRAGDPTCLTLDGYRNPCTVARHLPGPASEYHQHSIIADQKDNVWFTMGGLHPEASRAAIGYVKRDWKDIVMFPPLALFPLETTLTQACATLGDSGSGIAVDGSNGHVWFGNYCRKHIGRLQPKAVNLALAQPATQSATFCFLGVCGYASAANDGDISGDFFSGSVSHTGTNRPWWQVDLGAVRVLHDIEIWNRTDACCVNQLQNFNVFVSDTPFVSNDPTVIAATPGVLTIHQVDPPGRRFTAPITRTGRYVRVQLLGTTYALNLAEVVVIGEP
ncbi:MAG: hypothetical protein KIT14_17530 [bacterium]|nr:hypothetical protein [bacterium]